MISLLSLFSGIGAFEKALERLQIPFELINYCEIDPNAARAYSLIHNIPETKNAVDVTKIDCRNIPFGVDLLTYGFPFPAPFPLEYRLKDFLETTVDEKYFIKDSSLDYILSSGTKNFYYKPEIDLDVARPITATITKQHRAGLDNYISESYAEKGEKTPVDFLRIPEPTAQGYKDAFAGDCVNVGFPNSKTRRGRVTSQMSAALITSSQLGVVVPAKCNQIGQLFPKSGDPQAGRVYDPNGLFPTVRIRENGKTTDGLRIRKLTPLECFRLMSFDDKDFYTLRDHGFKDSAIYRAAGNSIVVDVLQYIFKSLFEQYKEVFISKQETFFDLLGESGVDDSANNQTSIFDYL